MQFILLDGYLVSLDADQCAKRGYTNLGLLKAPSFSTTGNER